jgi:integrase
VNWRFKVALVLAHETGHRLSSIRKLRWSDVDMEAERIHWRALDEKSRFEHESGMTSKAREAFKLARVKCPAIGDAPVLPAPKDRSKPLSRWLLLHWWYRAEQLAGIEHVRGRAWHSLRRKFATELKHAPLSDLKDLGGWKDHNTILKCYQRGDDSTKRAALASRRPLSRSHA